MSDRPGLVRPFTPLSFISFIFLLILAAVAARPIWHMFSWIDRHVPMPAVSKTAMVIPHYRESLIINHTSYVR